MKYFFDTEFIEDGKTIDLISIGMVSEDGREFYKCSTEAQLHRANEWVRSNVLVRLPSYAARQGMTDELVWSDRLTIRKRLLEFIGDDANPEFWAYYADYDWVALCQLFGTMMDLPKAFPMYCRDLKQLSVTSGSPTHPAQTGKHDALQDAKWNRELFDFLTIPKQV